MPLFEEGSWNLNSAEGFRHLHRHGGEGVGWSIWQLARLMIGCSCEICEKMICEFCAKLAFFGS